MNSGQNLNDSQLGSAIDAALAGTVRLLSEQLLKEVSQFVPTGDPENPPQPTTPVTADEGRNYLLTVTLSPAELRLFLALGRSGTVPVSRLTKMMTTAGLDGSGLVPAAASLRAKGLLYTATIDGQKQYGHTDIGDEIFGQMGEDGVDPSYRRYFAALLAL